MAAIFSDCAARLLLLWVAADMILPPEIFVPGHNPSHDAKCLASLKRDKSAPIPAPVPDSALPPPSLASSASTLNAVVTSMPSIRVKSTPHICNNNVRASNLGAFLGLPWLRLGLSGFKSLRARFFSIFSNCWSHSVNCTVYTHRAQGHRIRLPPVSARTGVLPASCLARLWQCPLRWL